MGEVQEITAEQIHQLASLVDKLKIAGNNALKSRSVKDAIRLYSDGIEAAMQIRDHVSDQLISQLYSNRAAAFLLEKQFVEAIDDSRKAIALDHANIKGYYRGAKGSIDLELYQQSCDFCEGGLRIDSSHAELRALLEASRVKLEAVREAKILAQRGFSQEDAINCQTALKELSEQYYLMKQKIASREFERSRNDRTVSVLSSMSDSEGPCYKAIGRGFILEDRNSVIKGLNERNSVIEAEVVELKKAHEVLEGRKNACEKEMTEIANYFNGKRQN